MNRSSLQAAHFLPAGRPWWKRSWFKAIASLVLVAVVVLVAAAEYVLHNAEPILRKRVIETLSARFHAPVELDRIDISLFKGIEVEGWGLRVLYGPETPPVPPARPMISVGHFSFRTSVHGLLHQPTHVMLVRVDDVEVHIPPAGERGLLWSSGAKNRVADPNDPRLKPKIALVVNEIQCRAVTLLLESGKPGAGNGRKPPLEFDIASLDLHDISGNNALRYSAELTNPKPVGRIQVSGHFGPWGNGSPAGQPGDTPIDGTYRFDHADLGTIKGVQGTLSSLGRFTGPLDHISIDGETDTPNFSLDISVHPMPLHTAFHAIVDGSNGDTILQPVHARLGGSNFTTSGRIVKTNGQGHDIQLDVDIPHGQMQDFLRLATKTSPPLLNGVLTMTARLHIPAGQGRVPAKLALAGAFHLSKIRFNNPRMQDRIDSLSARAQGRPEDVGTVSHTPEQAEAGSALGANISIEHGVMSLSDLRYTVPGALVLLNGVYSMDGKLFEFKGHVRTEATASEMVTGWKSLLLKPVDRFLQKNGAGLELPIEVSGTEGEVHFGLATHGADDKPSQLLSDVRGKQRSRQELTSARQESAQADADDARAARATTLEEAERAHNAAVRHRAEAQNKALAAQSGTGGGTTH